jgi:hypothetical protein
VRHGGISNHPAEAASSAHSTSARSAALQYQYSLLHREHDNDILHAGGTAQHRRVGMVAACLWLPRGRLAISTPWSRTTSVTAIRSRSWTCAGRARPFARSRERHERRDWRRWRLPGVVPARDRRAIVGVRNTREAEQLVALRTSSSMKKRLREIESSDSDVATERR